MEPESLPQLMRRRYGAAARRQRPGIHERLDPGSNPVTYETVRNLFNGKQRSTRDPRVIRDLVAMLAVPEEDVRHAMAVGPVYGDWTLPPRANALDPHERTVVLGVIDAILAAKRTTT